MDSQEVEPGEQSTHIKGAENAFRTPGEDGISQEDTCNSNADDPAGHLHPILFSRMPEGGEGDLQPPHCLEEGEKCLILLKTVQLKAEDDFQQDGPSCLVDGLQGLLSEGTGLVPSVEAVPRSISIQENPEEGLTVNFLESFYTIHEMEMMPVNGLKEAPAFNEDKRSPEKSPDILWIKVVLVPLD